jgi:hypothetical protein
MKFPILLSALLLIGCAPREKLPPVAWHSESEALHILAARAAQVHTVTAQGLLTMQRPDGQSVRLDLAMVRDREHHVRLRAWKLGRAVFDFTMTPQGVWMLMPDDPSIRNRVRDSQTPITKLADTFAVLDGELFSRPDVVTRNALGKLSCSATINGTPVRCEVDKQTLTPRRYVLSDDSGTERFTMDLSNYRMITGIPFARRYVATSEMGVITIALDDVELNTDLAPAAFVPPRRAEKVR